MLRTELGNAPQRRMGSGVIANKVNNARGLDDEQNRVMIFATSLDGGIQISPMKSQMLDLKPKFFCETRLNDQGEHCQVYKLCLPTRTLYSTSMRALGNRCWAGFDS